MKWLTIPFLLFTLSAFAQIDTTIYNVVEEMPRFAGCEDLEGSIAEKKSCADRKMLEFIFKNIKYPTISRENGLEGRIVVSFVIEKDGSISNIKMIRNPCCEEIKQMMLKLIKSFPKFEPDKHKGIPVRVQFLLPITVCLE
ncbi:MAG: energy transducer TonB [Saprospiraceae bacterium]